MGNFSMTKIGIYEFKTSNHRETINDPVFGFDIFFPVQTYEKKKNWLFFPNNKPRVSFLLNLWFFWICKCRQSDHGFLATLLGERNEDYVYKDVLLSSGPILFSQNLKGGG